MPIRKPPTYTEHGSDVTQAPDCECHGELQSPASHASAASDVISTIVCKCGGGRSEPRRLGLRGSSSLTPRPGGRIADENPCPPVVGEVTRACCHDSSIEVYKCRAPSGHEYWRANGCGEDEVVEHMPLETACLIRRSEITTAVLCSIAMSMREGRTRDFPDCQPESECANLSNPQPKYDSTSIEGCCSAWYERPCWPRGSDNPLHPFPDGNPLLTGRTRASGSGGTTRSCDDSPTGDGECPDVPGYSYQLCCQEPYFTN
jgi:hypothetical protein